VEEGLLLGVRLGHVEVRIVGREVRRFQEEQPLAERRVRLVRTVEPQEVEGDEPELAILILLNAGGVLRAGGQDRDGSLEGVARDRVAGVDDGLRADEFASRTVPIRCSKPWAR
jgi:hypothetical protein